MKQKILRAMGYKCIFISYKDWDNTKGVTTENGLNKREDVLRATDVMWICTYLLDLLMTMIRYLKYLF